ncbi:MAG: universal stress protein [bacterium]
MRVFKKILCPLDFSEASHYAFHYAKTFAKCFDSELVLLHVSPNLTDAYTSLLPDFPEIGLPHERDLLERFNECTSDNSAKFKKTILTGIPYIEILNYAKAEEFDLIILGAKGHSNFERLFLGSTSEKVVRNSSAPVLTVHPKPKGLPIKRILVPIDFSPLSFAVLPIVASIAEHFRSEIYLLHVVETGHQSDPERRTSEYEFFERVKGKLADQWELPEAFNEIETKKFIRHHTGSAGYGILEFSQDWDIDLVIMATHGRTGLSKVLMGSVTEKVIRIAPYPVLSIRSQTAGK